MPLADILEACVRFLQFGRSRRRSGLSKIRKGVKQSHVETVGKIAVALGVDVLDIIEDDAPERARTTNN
jgi:hypothetical protein